MVFEDRNYLRTNSGIREFVSTEPMSVFMKRELSRGFMLNDSFQNSLFRLVRFCS